jgi:hypothetical protein
MLTARRPGTLQCIFCLAASLKVVLFILIYGLINKALIISEYIAWDD